MTARYDATRARRVRWRTGRSALTAKVRRLPTAVRMAPLSFFTSSSVGAAHRTRRDPAVGAGRHTWVLRPELVPVVLGHVDAVMLGRRADVGDRLVAVRVADVLHLVGPGQRGAHVLGVGQPLLALLGKGIHAVRQLVAVLGRQLVVFIAVLVVWFPSGMHRFGFPAATGAHTRG